MITQGQGIFITFLFCIGGIIVFGGTYEAAGSSWLSLIIAFGLACILMLCFSRILKINENKNIFKILENNFGKISGKIITAILVCYAIFLSAFTANNYSEFIIKSSLSNTPINFIEIFFFVTAAFLVIKSISVAAIFTRIAAKIVLIILIFIFILALSKINFDFFKPPLYNGIKPIAEGSFSLLAFPFAEIFILLSVFDKFKPDVSYKKVLFFGGGLSFLVLLAIFLCNSLILGEPMQKLVDFQTFYALGIADFADFFKRLEVISAITFLFCDFTKVCFCLFFALRGMQNIIGTTHIKRIALPLSAFCYLASVTIFHNSFSIEKWVTGYKFIALPLVLSITLMLLITSEVKLSWTMTKTKEPKKTNKTN